MISISREKLWLTPLMKLRGLAQFLALPLITILKFKTLSLNMMKLCYWTMAFRMDLLLHPMAVLVPTYPWPWYLPLPHAFVAPIMDPLPAPPTACGIHVPHAVQCVLALEPDRDPDDQVAPPTPLLPNDTMMTIAAALQRLTELVGANQCPADQKPKS